MQVLDGKAVAERLKQELAAKIQDERLKTQRVPHLVVVLVGEDPASQVYVKNKHLACEKIGMKSTVLRKPVDMTQADLEKLLHELNADNDVDGVLVQLPLPKHLNANRVLEILSPEKDADGLTYASLGFLWAGRPKVKPCTPSGVMKILEFYNIPIAGRKAVVVGRSNIVGKPMAHLLTEANATVTLCHSKTKNLQEYTRAADIVVVAAGQPEMLGAGDFAPHAVVIDVGIHRRANGTLCGDVRFKELEGKVAAATPVPGGVGPMTIACLLENTVQLAQQRRK